MNKGDKLRILRERKGKSQTEAARFLGLSKQTLYKYEKNIITNIPSDVIERIAKYYNTTPEYIMGWVDDTPEAQKIRNTYINNPLYDLSEDEIELIELYRLLTKEAKEVILNSIRANVTDVKKDTHSKSSKVG